MPVLGGCSGTKSMQSRVPDRAVTIDSHVDEWTSELTSFEDDAISVGVRNDDTSLYVAAMISDPELVRHVMVRGLVLWLDPDGGTDEVFGIQYPIGLRGNRLGEWTSEGRPLDDGWETMRTHFEASLSELEIRGTDGQRVRQSVDAGAGIQASANLEGAGTLTYEVKLPLQLGDTSTHAVGAAPGAKIGVGWVIPEVDRGAMRRQRPNDRPPGGRGGGMRGARPPGGGPLGSVRGRGLRPASLELWAEVTLATPES